MSKHIFITGGVVSSLGKGINAASIGQVLKSRGYSVFVQKFDPYINVDSSLMSPYQHGEIFVTKDGAETDLDLGHYERFIDVELTKESSVSSGKIYESVIKKEREGYYKGATIQVIPHITDEIILRLKEASNISNADIIITEIGGTVGDIESLPFLEAIRQARNVFGYNNTLYIHNTLVPYLKAAKEIKTKPTQHSVSELKSLGIDPDILMLRTEVSIPNHAKEKIALFSGIKREAIFESIDVDVIYEQIINMEKENIDDLILDHFKINNNKKANLSKWEELINKIKNLNKNITVNIIGKYVSHHDAYLSVVESLNHAGYFHNCFVNINWIDLKNIKNININKEEAYIFMDDCFDNKNKDIINLIKNLRINNINTLFLGDSFNLLIKEYFNNELNILNNDLFESLNNKFIGSKNITIKNDTLLKDIYNENNINERFRTNISFNNKYINNIKDTNLKISSNHNDIITSAEINNNFFIALNYLPQLTTRPLNPHKVFIKLIERLLK